LEVVSVCPCVAVPEIAGNAVLDGGAASAVTVAVCAEVTDAEPAELVAVTITSMVDPTSEACSV
jgi:hypothetical protein